MKKYVQPGYDEFGREVPDQTPVEMPVGFRRPPSLQETIQRLIRTEMSEAAAASGFETFEESDDFDEDDDEPLSPYEVHEMQVDVPAGELADRVEEEYNRRSGNKPVDRSADGKSQVGVDEGRRAEVGTVHSGDSKRTGKTVGQDGAARNEGSRKSGTGGAEEVES